LQNDVVRHEPSARAQILTRRTYSRPKTDGSFETWKEIVDRVVGHQKWLWVRARKQVKLGSTEEAELEELRHILLEREGCVSGRTLWLGGTSVARTREASMFNCAFTKIETVHDVVDAFWLLLQGCGVGFEPIVGSLNGFAKPVKIEVERSDGHKTKGIEGNVDYFDLYDNEKVWFLQVGDSAEAWAKSVGKLLAMKTPVDKIVLDFRQIRGPGIRLRGYGWISSGDETLAPAFVKIAEILNRAHDRLLTRIDILDIINHLGTTLSSRRSAEIALVPVDDLEAHAFATAKKDFWLHGNEHRQQSNNSLVFSQPPSEAALRQLFATMQEAGGSEPGFINGQQAKLRGPWFAGVNPCAEILLPNKGFCNLVEINLSKFNGDAPRLWNVARILARANYRQTCVNLEDGILQRAWHENNEFLRLCGVGVTGVAEWEFKGDRAMWRQLRAVGRRAAEGMAAELGTPRPKAVTTVKPSGTLSKIMDTTEGVHTPLGQFIFNNVRFSKHDPYIKSLKRAGYRVFDDPSSSDAVLVTFPVEYKTTSFTEVGGRQVNLETAIDQLERYKLLMECYVDHNCSITVSYSPDEVPIIVKWLYENWNCYVGVSFIYRNDPTKTAADLGYLYLPQEVVTEEDYRAYVTKLKPLKSPADGTVELKEEADDYEIDTGTECANGVCPVR